MASLYELTRNYTFLQHQAEEGFDGLEDTIESLGDAIEDKLEGCSMVIKNIESDIDGIDKEIKRLSERKKTLQNSVVRIKQSMYDSLQDTGMQKVKTPRFTISLRKSTAVQIENEDLIPEEFVKISRSISKTELTKRLKEQEVPGAVLVENQSLQIR